MEKEMLGIYVSGHPLEEFREEIISNTTLSSMDLKTGGVEVGEELSMDEDEDKLLSDGRWVIVGGIITEKKIKATRNDNLMAFVTLEDLYGTMEIIVFPQVLNKYQELLTRENIVIIKGKLSIREDEEPKIICDEVEPINRLKATANHSIDGININPKSNLENINSNIENGRLEKKNSKLYIKITKDITGKKNGEWMKSTLSLLEFFRGKTPVYFYYPDEKKVKIAEQKYWVTPSSVLISELEERFGRDNVKLV